MEISHDIRQLSAEKIGGDEANLDETETMLFYELIKHILERISKNFDFENIE